jgi:hypothetical protein
MYTDKRDFFPRLGSEILSVFLSDDDSNISIVLKENSVKIL